MSPRPPCSLCDPNALEQEESFTLRRTENRFSPFFQLAGFISGGVIDSFCFLLSGLRGHGSSLPDRMKGADAQLHLSGCFLMKKNSNENCDSWFLSTVEQNSK